VQSPEEQFKINPTTTGDIVSQISKYPGHIQPPSGAVAYAIMTSFNGATNFNLASLSESISAVKPTRSPATKLIGRNKIPNFQLIAT